MGAKENQRTGEGQVGRKRRGHRTFEWKKMKKSNKPQRDRGGGQAVRGGGGGGGGQGGETRRAGEVKNQHNKVKREMRNGVL